MNGIPWKPYTYGGTGADTLTAFMDDQPAPQIRYSNRILSPCGTDAAYRRHMRHGERCEACAEGNRIRWQFRKVKANGTRRERRAQDAALRDADNARRRARRENSEG